MLFLSFGVTSAYPRCRLLGRVLLHFGAGGEPWLVLARPCSIVGVCLVYTSLLARHCYSNKGFDVAVIYSAYMALVVSRVDQKWH